MAIMDRLRLFEWKKTRHVTLGVDRDIFKDGEEANEYISAHGLLPLLIHNLKRTAGVVISDWMWVREWHSDGYPHFHLFVEVEKEGKAGMIGEKLLHKYWPWAKWVHEWFVESEKHWKALTGYFGKHGYFAGVKGVQGVLPKWALGLKKRIRRYGSAVLPGVDGEFRERVRRALGRSVVRGERRSYCAILESCGEKSFVSIANHILNISMVVDVNADVFKKNFKGDFIKGVGYLAEIDEGELFVLSEKHSGLMPLVDRMLDAIERYDGFKGFEDEVESWEKEIKWEKCGFLEIGTEVENGTKRMQ